MTPRRSMLAVALGAAYVLGAAPALAATSCAALEGCAAKACRIDAQLGEAKAKGNAKLVASLERDRREIAHCSDDGLKQKRKVALEQAQRRVDQREAELKAAQAGGDAAKQKKAQQRLDSANKAFADVRDSPL